MSTMSETFTTLIERAASADEIGRHLDDLPAEKRVEECLALPGRLEPKLWELVSGKGTITMAELVPVAEETVIYELKNNLPVFNISQKRFYRPKQGEVVGYNHTGAVAATFAGPGYFFAIDGENGEVVFDYTRLPTLQPPGWPEIKPNTGLIPGITYGNMLDYARRVSKHTVIGAAFKDGKPRNAYFLLTRAASQSG